jgi:hypothetical protein
MSWGRSVLTPVRDDGLELLQLRRPLREGRELKALELRGYRVSHVGVGCDSGGRRSCEVWYFDLAMSWADPCCDPTPRLEL